jgi:hypothetical protein
MQAKVLIFSLSCVLFLMVGWMGHQYGLAKNASFDESVQVIRMEPNRIMDTNGSDNWIQRFAHANKSDFSYPASELKIKLDLITQLQEEKLYRVVISHIDSYKFFCLNQILKSNNIKFSYYKTRGFVKLVITTKNKPYMLHVLKQLKEYGIEYRVKETIRRG